MFAGFAEKMWTLCCNAGHAVMESIVYQLVLVLCRPNEQNVTQLIVVTFATVRTAASISHQGAKYHKEAHIFNITLNVCSNLHEKNRLRHVNFFRFTSTQKVIQIWTPNRPRTVICSFATWARKETRNSIFCKSLKLPSPCRLFSRFTLSPPALSCCTSYSRGSQPFSDHLPLRHFARWACTPKISYDKKNEQNNINPLNF